MDTKKLPTGIQSFAKLRNEGCLYIDKTKYVYKLVTEGSIYFLSRPRNFGKSLLVSTLEALFSGRKDLFEGLYICDKWDWSQQYPVIRLDFETLAFNTPDELSVSLSTFVKSVAEEYDVPIRTSFPKTQFAELLENIHRSTGKTIVVLIDESYKPVTDCLSNSALCEANKNILNSFYEILKACGDCLNFVFMTGTSRFFGDSPFSSFNSPLDITSHWRYSAVCGFTQDELENCFNDYIDEVANLKNISGNDLLNEIKAWYGGYSWDGKTFVYNPFSILSFFEAKEFGHYWLRTAPPDVLTQIYKERNQLKPVFEPVEADSNVFEGFNTAEIDEISLSAQTGYLTAKREESAFGYSYYVFEIPNTDIRESFVEHLLCAYSNYPVERIHALTSAMQKQIFNGEALGLEQNLIRLFSDIQLRLQTKTEAYYHSLFLLLMRLLGFDISRETLAGAKCIDAVLRTQQLIVIAEIKYSSKKKLDNLLDEAMKQIHDRRYYETYHDKKVMLMAVAYIGRSVRCKMEISELAGDKTEEIDENEAEDSTEMFEHFHFNVDKGQSPLRIDKFVTNRIENASRKKIKAAASADCIWVNGEPVKPSYKVKPLDNIAIMMPFRRRGIELIAENIPINIVYEDDDVIVVDKEAGMVVHPGHGNYSGTLVNALLYHLEQQGKHALIEDDETGGLLVHRIDKNTSGLLVVAKNLIANAKLAKQFFYHSTKRKYIALVWGAFDEKEGTVDTYVGRSLQDRTKMTVFKENENESAKHAITHYKVVEEFGYVTLIECRLETGRTHQIRVHMEYLRHPLFSDERYGGDRILRGTTFSKYTQFVENCFAILPRQALHAAMLGFRHPTSGKEMIFESQLPTDMATVIDRWRNYVKNRDEKW